MALYYLETSALVKLYVQEPGTERLLRLASRGSNHRFAVLPLARVEFHSAIRKRQRLGDVENLVANQLIARFEQHMETKFVRQGLSDSVLDTATGLVDRYPLRAYDAVQLAGCVALKMTSRGEEPAFVCADAQLLRAAESEGLQFMDPCE